MALTASVISTIFRWLGSARYQTTPPSLANGDLSELQCAADGSLMVNIAGYGGSAATTWVDFQANSYRGVILGGAGRLWQFVGSNDSGTKYFVMVFDSASLVGDGATPVFSIPVDAGSTFELSIVRPRSFTNGIVWCTSSTPSILTSVPTARINCNAEKSL